MIRFTLAQLIAHRVRLALTVIAVILGVAFVTGSLVLNDTAQRLFDEQFRTASAGADLTVRTATAFDSGMGVEVERDPLPAHVVEQVAAIDGVDAAIAVAKGSVRLEDREVDLGAAQLTSWIPQPVGAFPLRDGTAPVEAGEVALDVASAGTLGLRIGDRLTLVADQRIEVRIVGLVGFGDAEGPPVGTAVIASLGTAQEALGLGAAVSELMITTDLAVNELQPVLGEVLGASYQVATAQDLATAGAEAAASNLEMLQIVLVAMSVAALLMGSFLIGNTFAIVVSQRTRELAMVRATGATGAQILRSVLGEALVVGMAASGIGTMVGIGGAIGLRALARGAGVTIPDGDLVVEPRTVLVAVCVGVIVTLAAAIGPARRAAAISPVAAMRQSAAEARLVSRARTTVGAALLTVGAVLAAMPSFGADMPMLAVGLGIALAGVILIAPVVIRPMVRAIGAPLSRMGVAVRLAQESAERAPRRTSATVMALALGLALMSFAAIVGASVKTATGEQYREVIQADVVVESAGQEMLGGVHAAVFDEVLGVDEVGAATRLKYGHWRDAGMMSALSAVDPDAIEEVAVIRMIDGEIADLATPGGVVIAQRVAEERDLGVGDELTMTFARTGEKALPVVGVVADTTARALQTDFLVSLDTYAQHFTEDMDASVFVVGAAGVSADRLAAALERELVDHPTVQVRDQAAVIAGRTQIIDQLFGLVTVLLAFALLIAVLGIANTLALSIVERTREIGLLRALGMSRAHVGAMVQSEAVFVAATAVVIGTVLGAAAAFAAVGALGTIAPLPLVVPLDQLAWLGAAVAFAGLLAAFAPARRAAALPALEAISHD
ncbi:ABC transporter permease [Ruicaihuangia caeni]|uniref:FtsX-like permease family protein n=1 Tax=Ruicaihuangia caeni TaxID=3042517 RepID=A0AAW6T439_9MICO|nr:ABC transporter permease [Klugiella sp. YN-L-19]MDI2097846.1 FtsX-like permease family protein [Klugiella sp. YN-L-19]